MMLFLLSVMLEPTVLAIAQQYTGQQTPFLPSNVCSHMRIDQLRGESFLSIQEAQSTVRFPHTANSSTNSTCLILTVLKCSDLHQENITARHSQPHKIGNSYIN